MEPTRIRVCVPGQPREGNIPSRHSPTSLCSGLIGPESHDEKEGLPPLVPLHLWSRGLRGYLFERAAVPVSAGTADLPLVISLVIYF